MSGEKINWKECGYCKCRTNGSYFVWQIEDGKVIGMKPACWEHYIQYRRKEGWEGMVERGEL